MIFSFFILFLILLRIGELFLSRKNEQWLLQHGAIEYGQKHYPFIVGLHVLFIISLIVEYSIIDYSIAATMRYSIRLLILFFVLMALKAWVILSLGKFWNTKIYRVNRFPLIRRGPYRYVKHPNYIIVIAEIAIIPLIFHLYYTAVIFTLLNGLMLAWRIKEENKALNL
ncbi:methyltransferase [Dysgonomonas alginatilytica]|uniref:Methyltransferase n=1 Tax=Dysgonomonas alginatilytica TaxID=1605892 RepID=A0A2V3PS87_9BACT|nr:isoprenylcysteine carboxylmethyltransferase family protein [Dysgonomonas alginatilytica]PXV65516.1 methyltransferase [Dysgonomonas alginatilytica]